MNDSPSRWAISRSWTILTPPDGAVVCHRSRISFTVTSPSIVVKRQLPGNRSAVLGRPSPSPGTGTAAPLVPYSAGDSASDGDSDTENRAVGTNKNTAAGSTSSSAPAKEARTAGEAGAGLGTAAVKKTPSVPPGPAAVGAVTPCRVLTERQPLVPGATSPWTVREAAPGSPLHSEDSARSHSSHGSVGCTSPWLVTEKVRWWAASVTLNVNEC